MRFIIVGNSAAGVTAAETLRRLGDTGEITMVSEEPETAYARCLLPDVLAGKRTPSSLALRPDDFYRRLGVTFLSGTRVVELWPGDKKILLQDGRTLSYDRLLLATGAGPVVPEWAGPSGVFTLRTLAEARRLAALAGQVSRAVVAGGGLVGLKAAYGLKQAGVTEVTVVVASPRLLIRQLDEQASALVESELLGIGLDFVYNAGVGSLVSDAEGRLTGVELEEGRTLPAGLLLAAKGVRPNSGMLAQAGGQVGSGIRVDAYLATSLADVYAAGDCIEVTDRWTGERVSAGLWPLACEQGRLAAANMLGRKLVYPAPLTRLNSARFGKVDVVSAGSLDGPGIISRYDRGTYRRLVFDGDRLAGYILAGRVDGAGVYTALVKSGRPAWRWRRELLAGRAGEVAVDTLGTGRTAYLKSKGGVF